MPLPFLWKMLFYLRCLSFKGLYENAFNLVNFYERYLDSWRRSGLWCCNAYKIEMEVIQFRSINKSVKFINKLSFLKRAIFLTYIIDYPVFLTYSYLWCHKLYSMLQKKIHEVHEFFKVRLPQFYIELGIMCTFNMRLMSFPLDPPN